MTPTPDLPAYHSLPSCKLIISQNPAKHHVRPPDGPIFTKPRKTLTDRPSGCLQWQLVNTATVLDVIIAVAAGITGAILLGQRRWLPAAFAVLVAWQAGGSAAWLDAALTVVAVAWGVVLIWRQLQVLELGEAIWLVFGLLCFPCALAAALWDGTFAQSLELVWLGLGINLGIMRAFIWKFSDPVSPRLAVEATIFAAFALAHALLGPLILGGAWAYADVAFRLAVALCFLVWISESYEAGDEISAKLYRVSSSRRYAETHQGRQLIPLPGRRVADSLARTADSFPLPRTGGSGFPRATR